MPDEGRWAFGGSPLSIFGDVGAAVLDFLEQDGETLDERHQRWGQALQAHPRFEEAIRLSMHKSLVRYGQTPLMAHISKDVVRIFYGYFALALDAAGGPLQVSQRPPSTLKEKCLG